MFAGSILRFVERHADLPVMQRLAAFSYALYRAAHNPGYRFETNGEGRVLSILAAEPGKPVIFDVGSNEGQWARRCLKAFGDRMELHCFEPTQRSFRALKQGMDGQNCVQLHNCGLSDHDSEAVISIPVGVTEKSSVHGEHMADIRHLAPSVDRETVRLLQGDGFCAEHGIEAIDFLKIDTEGHDLSVLRGCRRMLSERRIRVIQFEYNRWNLYVGSPLLHFHVLLNRELSDRGYRIGRIYPRSVQFREHRVADDNYIDGNFIAVLATEDNLLKTLAGPLGLPALQGK